MRGLYVEDDLELSKVIIENLKERGVSVRWTRSIKESIKALKEESFHFYILDIGLTDGEGYEIAHYLKKNKLPEPLIFLTARSEAQDRLKGYEYGACEYIPKPFLFEELWLRLDYAIQQYGQVERYPLEEGFVFDFKAQKVEDSLRKKSIDLTLKEALFFKYIIDSSPKPMTRSEVLDKVWGEEKYPTERTVDNLVVRLRQKLGPLGKKIKSMRSVGYRWSE